ncbi:MULTISPECIES: hypothetical protein [Pseudofrankia]|uniref:hypothetical protein n=1 Tax=Pseudofrankia TaxID=2994363 RepID=UPI000234CA2E|nr:MULTISPECIES: hypothetical protein [Pseudofrankia]OHV33396.1 hypothetical protein BCD49_27440 [Pseudofrankia sp. EUN1h]
MVFVAHRLCTERAADRIILMDEGGVRAIGTGDEVLHIDELHALLTQGQLLAGPPWTGAAHA